MLGFDKVLELLSQETLLNNTVLQWLTGLAAAIGVGVALYVAKGILARHAAALAAKHPSDWLDTLGELVQQTRRWFLLLLALYSGSLLFASLGKILQIDPVGDRHCPACPSSSLG